MSHVTPFQPFKLFKWSEFLDCQWTRRFWITSSLQCSVNPLKIKRFGEWLSFMVPRCVDFGYCKKEAGTKVTFACWQIWKERNLVCFEDRRADIDRAVVQLQCNIDEFSELIPQRSKTVVLL